MPKKPGVLIIVENLTMPVDRRVWTEARSLRDAGYTVSVVCPKGGRHTQSYELLDGIHVFRHPLPIEADGAIGYFFEYTWSLIWEFALSIKAYCKVGFNVVQACNPPDLIFIVGAFWKYLFGMPFIFDHHDINPELYEAKYEKRGVFYKLLLLLERLTFRTSDVVIATNEAFRDVALERGGMDPERVFIVRSIPDLSRFKRVAPNERLRNGRKYVAGYVGIMGAQDGVDHLIRAMGELVHVNGRRDVQCVIVGTGTEVPNLERLIGALDLDQYVTMTGFQSSESHIASLSTFDIGVIPDPKNSFNDKISMNKVFEYMTLGIPFAGYDLDEVRKTAADAALYAGGNDPKSLAAAMEALLDDDELRRNVARVGEKRAKALLKWENERARLLGAYDLALSGQKKPLRGPAESAITK